MIYIFQQSLNALQLGSIYALIALGYTMVYGILTMINFAHGDYLLVGAFFCFLLAVYFHLSFVPSCFYPCWAWPAWRDHRTAGIQAAAQRSARLRHHHALGVGLFLENFTLALSPYPNTFRRFWKHHLGSRLAFHFLAADNHYYPSLVLMLILDFIVQRTKAAWPCAPFPGTRQSSR